MIRINVRFMDRVRRRTDLDDAVFLRGWVKSILNVTLANNTKMSDNVDGGRSQHIIISIREGLRRGNDNRVASVNTQGVEVLHEKISQSKPMMKEPEKK